MMRDALDGAKKVPSLTVSTGGYNVWRTGTTTQDRPERWQAGQSINLSGKDAEAMLRMVGDLQQKGFVQGNLGWRLSRETEHAARQNATKQALSGLRGRADDAAGILGLKFGSFREVRLDNVTPLPLIPRPQAYLARSAVASPPPPSAESEDIPVTATAEADIILTPH
jgi:predicted secreted protein